MLFFVFTCLAHLPIQASPLADLKPPEVESQQVTLYDRVA